MRGAEIEGMLDEQGKVIEEGTRHHSVLINCVSQLGVVIASSMSRILISSLF